MINLDEIKPALVEFQLKGKLFKVKEPTLAQFVELEKIIVGQGKLSEIKTFFEAILEDPKGIEDVMQATTTQLRKILQNISEEAQSPKEVEQAILK